MWSIVLSPVYMVHKQKDSYQCTKQSSSWKKIYIYCIHYFLNHKSCFSSLMKSHIIIITHTHTHPHKRVFYSDDNISSFSSYSCNAVIMESTWKMCVKYKYIYMFVFLYKKTEKRYRAFISTYTSHTINGSTTHHPLYVCIEEKKTGSWEQKDLNIHEEHDG